MNQRATWAWATAIAGGASLWLAAAVVSGKREAWDASVYWTIAYPLSIALAGVLGFRVPEKAWRWGLAVMWAQALVLMVSGSDFGQLPPGLIMFSILALPAVFVAMLAARLRLRRGNS